MYSTAWLARNDVARRTIRQRGVTRFMAVCLLGGYAWLGAAGAMAAMFAAATPGVLFLISTASSINFASLRTTRRESI